MTKLNKITSVLLSAIMVIGIFSIIPFAAGAETSGSFEYSVLDDGTASIKKYIDNGSKTVDIPSTIDGYKVTEIGDDAFYDCTGLTSVTIPSSVKRIEYDAFEGCTGLTSVTIPSSVTEIGDSAFAGCTGLKSVTIPNSVTEIGNIAFFGCTSLKSVTIPSSVTEIGIDAFGGCTGLKSITVDKNNKNYTSVEGVLFNKNKTKILGYPNAKGSSYVIPSSVTEIGYSAFYGCTGLKSVTIPSSVKKIGDSAFAGCTGLKSVTIPNSVTEIGNYAFAGCTGLKSVTIPSSVKKIGYRAFFGCTGLKSVTIPNSVKEISDSAFFGCTGLKSVTIPSTVTEIGNNAFGYTYSNKHYVKISGFTIYGKKGTAAERYANDNSFKFVEGVAPAEPTVPTGVKLNQSSLTLGEGESYGLISTVLPANAKNKTCTWSTSNSSVATVSNTGKVIAKATGTAVITVKTVNGKTATCKITVKPAPTSVKINPTALTLGKGESYTVNESTSKGSYANGANLKWTSTNTRVATVQKGKGNKAVIKAVGTGTANIKITLFNGKTATCKVTVTTLRVPDDMKNLLSQNGNTVDDLSAVNCSQLITVDSNGATAKINFYRLQNNQWIFDNDMSCSGFVGAKGVTQDMQEGRKASPKGLYSIGDAFYINNAPATGLTSFKITKDTYWVDDPNSAYYNKRVEGTQNKDWNSAERMIEHPAEYEYGCVINYNTNAVYNAGSAIFFHVSNKPTAGCIGTSKEFVLKYLSKLNSSSNPYILIV